MVIVFVKDERIHDESYGGGGSLEKIAAVGASENCSGGGREDCGAVVWVSGGAEWKGHGSRS